MAHHAYFFAGERASGIAAARAYAATELGLTSEHTPDLMVYEFRLFSVDDARKVISLAQLSATTGDHKLIVIVADRLFHEAQNALLKLFEEPPKGTTVALIVPSEGQLLRTLRSRMLPLPTTQHKTSEPEEVRAFLSANSVEREKIIEKLLDRTKSDKDHVKQAARAQALQLLEGLTRKAHATWRKKPGDTQLVAYLEDLSRFTPIVHERSAPLKPIFEHLLITMPAALS